MFEGSAEREVIPLPSKKVSSRMCVRKQLFRQLVGGGPASHTLYKQNLPRYKKRQPRVRQAARAAGCENDNRRPFSGFISHASEHLEIPMSKYQIY